MMTDQIHESDVEYHSGQESRDRSQTLDSLDEQSSYETNESDLEFVEDDAFTDSDQEYDPTRDEVSEVSSNEASERDDVDSNEEEGLIKNNTSLIEQPRVFNNNFDNDVDGEVSENEANQWSSQEACHSEYEDIKLSEMDVSDDRSDREQTSFEQRAMNDDEKCQDQSSSEEMEMNDDAYDGNERFSEEIEMNDNDDAMVSQNEKMHVCKVCRSVKNEVSIRCNACKAWTHLICVKKDINLGLWFCETC